MREILTYDTYQQELEKISRKYIITSIGKTALNYDIYMVTIGHGKKIVQLSGAWHGDEWLTTSLLLKLINESEVFDNSDYLFQIVPLVNPEGFDIATKSYLNEPLSKELALICNEIIKSPMNMNRWRANALGLDPNLDFSTNHDEAIEQKLFRDYPHPRGSIASVPFSSKEATVMRYLMEKNADKLRMILCYHSQGEVLFWRNPTGNETEIMKLVADTYAEETNYNLVKGKLTHGGCRDYAVSEYNIPGLTVEIGKGENPLPIEMLDSIYKKNEPALKKVLKLKL